MEGLQFHLTGDKFRDKNSNCDLFLTEEIIQINAPKMFFCFHLRLSPSSTHHVLSHSMLNKWMCVIRFSFENSLDILLFAYGKIDVQVSHTSHEEEEKDRSQHEWLCKHENRVEIIVNLERNTVLRNYIFLF